MLSPIPGAVDVHRLVAVALGDDRRPMSYQDYLALRDENQSFAAVAACQDGWAAVTGGDVPERVYVTMASASYFETLSIRPALGRAFLPSGEPVPDRGTVAVMKHVSSRASWSVSAGTTCCRPRGRTSLVGVPCRRACRPREGTEFPPAS